MITRLEVDETNKMIRQENCISDDLEQLKENIRNKICTKADRLVETGREIEGLYGIPIVNKRISVTPIALVGGAACRTPQDFAEIALVLDECAKTVGVNFIGGFSALVQKGITPADRILIDSIPEADYQGYHVYGLFLSKTNSDGKMSQRTWVRKERQQ